MRAHSLPRSETVKNVLMFTTTPDSAIDETEPSPFPAGCVFISSGARALSLPSSVSLIRSALRYLRALRTTHALTHAPRGAVADKLYDVTVNRACPGRLVSFSGEASAGTPMRRVRSRGALSRVTSGGDLRLIKTCACPISRCCGLPRLRCADARPAADAAGALRNTPSFSDLYGSANNLSALNEV